MRLLSYIGWPLCASLQLILRSYFQQWVCNPEGFIGNDFMSALYFRLHVKLILPLILLFSVETVHFLYMIKPLSKNFVLIAHTYSKTCLKRSL